MRSNFFFIRSSCALFINSVICVIIKIERFHIHNCKEMNCHNSNERPPRWNAFPFSLPFRLLTIGFFRNLKCALFHCYWINLTVNQIVHTERFLNDLPDDISSFFICIYYAWNGNLWTKTSIKYHLLCLFIKVNIKNGNDIILWIIKNRTLYPCCLCASPSCYEIMSTHT